MNNIEKELTKEELLSIAIKKYSVGTVFYPAHLSKKAEYVCEIFPNECLNFDGNDILFYSTNNEIAKNKKGWFKAVYFNGKWAEIISGGHIKKNEYTHLNKLLRKLNTIWKKKNSKLEML